MAQGKEHKPTQETRDLVKRLSALGCPRVDIGIKLKINTDTLAKYYQQELDDGRIDANSIIAGTLFNKAKSGDTAAAMFWAKTRMQWRETDRLEVTGVNGGPIQGVLTIVRELDGASAGLPKIEG